MGVVRAVVAALWRRLRSRSTLLVLATALLLASAVLAALAVLRRPLVARAPIVLRREIPLFSPGYYWDAREVCLGTEHNALDAPPGSLQLILPASISEGARDVADTSGPLLHSFEGRPTRLGFRRLFWVRTSRAPRAVFGLDGPCRINGTTLWMEESAGAPGHIAHFAENIVKYFAFANGAYTDQVWFHERGVPPMLTDWEHSMLALSLGLHFAELADAARRRAQLLELLPLQYTDSYLRQTRCGTVCFERLLLPSAEHIMFFSREHADLVRERAWEHCGVPPLRRGQADATAPTTVLHVPRSYGRRIVNVDELLQALTARGLQVIAPPDESSFCSQVRAYAAADIVVNMHGAGNTNVMFMRPRTVLIEVFNRGFNWPCFKIVADEASVHYTDFVSAHAVQRTDGRGEAPAPTQGPKDADTRIDLTVFARHFDYAAALYATSVFHPCQHRPAFNASTATFHELNWAHCGP